MRLDKLDSNLLRYLIEQEIGPEARLPALTELSNEMGISVGKLREQLEVARQLQILSVRPRTGIRREPFDFHPSVLTGLLFGLASKEAAFAQFSALRQAIEGSFWHEAVVELTGADLARLSNLVTQAWVKLRGEPAHIPADEHRDLHLTLFSRLANPFVRGLLAAYWDAYEATELTLFAPYQYWVEVWTYHERIVDALASGDFELGRQLLIEHFSLLRGDPATGFTGNGSSAARDAAASV